MSATLDTLTGDPVGFSLLLRDVRHERARAASDLVARIDPWSRRVQA